MKKLWSKITASIANSPYATVVLMWVVLLICLVWFFHGPGDISLHYDRMWSDPANSRIVTKDGGSFMVQVKRGLIIKTWNESTLHYSTLEEARNMRLRLIKSARDRLNYTQAEWKVVE